ncbi:MAG: 2-hydroxyacyl-CoA dehydratase [Parasporobacterium sp.]|nr:2-hydroxyacyl-CoA dehydratase [Parasporobacterium sp.]
MNAADLHEQEKRKRQEERFRNKMTKTSARYLRRMEELKGAPDSLAPFLQTLRRVYLEMENPLADQEKPIVGTYCVMAPQELIYAAGAVPVKLCSGSYTAFSIGDDIVPRDACPLVKAVAGFQDMELMPIYRDCSLMAVPITCDCKKKIVELLEKTHDVYPLQVPVSREDEDVDQYVEELYGFMDRLEELTGREITWDHLAKGMNIVGRSRYELSRFLELKKSMPYLMKGTHILAVMNAAAYLPADVWAGYMHELNEELTVKVRERQRAVSRDLPRIMVTGSPLVFPNMKIPLLIEEMGGILAADETCMGERGMSDPAVVVDKSFDGMIRALANQAVRPCSCPTFVNNKERIFRIRQMIEDYRIQGVIYHVLRGCLVYDFEYKLIEEELGRMGIPVIRLESDYNEEDVEQLRIRIEAFIELIKLKEQNNGNVQAGRNEGGM